jgi:YD repeat-containing protein
MSSVTVDRGIHGNDYDIPNTRQTFDYARGVRDRHEREFLGFGEVTTWQVDPANNNIPLRQSVEVYDTTSIYTAGNLLQTYVADPQGNPCVKTENKYYNYSLTNDCDTRSYSGGRFSYSTANFRKWDDRGAAYCPKRFTETRRFEGGSDSTVMAQDWYQYYDRAGDHGLVRNYRHRVGGGLTEGGTGTYDYQTNIEYSYNLTDNAHIFGLPKRVKVTNRRGGLFHLTEASYHLRHFNQITQVKRLMSIGSVSPNAGDPGVIPNGRDGEGTNGIGGGGTPFDRYNPDQEDHLTVEYYPDPVYAITDYSYDLHGNLVSATLPMGSDSTRVQYQYHHETTQNSYLSGIVDSYGLHSHSGETDYRFGITNKQVDKNGAVYRTANDNIGRLTSVKSPMDSASAMPAMSFRYHPRATVTNGVITTPAYATAVYYFPNTVFDNEVPVTYTDSMHVVTFVDGFGRPIQVRKDGVVWEGSENVGKTIVTGRTDYDGYGRAVRSYYPSMATANTVETYAAGAQTNEYYTTTAYDQLDRETAVTLPDNTTTSYQYGIDVNATSTTVIDANGNASRTVTDGDGRTVRAIQYKGDVGAEALNTTFAYDGIGRLITVTDTEGNVTSSTYDLGDRRTEVIHPASGKTTFTYDALGNVLTRQTANLSGKGQFIRYTYEQGRLKRVTYPEHPENDVIYHYGDENAEQGLRGRVKFREDGSGGNEYHYDLLGNVSRMKRTVTIPGNTIATAEMTWTYDNFGKLKQMQFPRTNGISERITYHYDRAGQLQSVYNGDLASYHYIQEIGYDKFGDRVHIKYGNGSKTTYN